MTFLAPTTYADAKALMGQVVDTPIGSLECNGCGSSGSTITLRFPGITWSSVDGWLTDEQRKVRDWNRNWDKLPANGRKLITLVLGADLADLPIVRRSNPDKLLRIAKARLHKQGTLEHDTCGRCGGSGKHSYNQRDGDTCWGCNGKGLVWQTTTNCLKALKGKS